MSFARLSSDSFFYVAQVVNSCSKIQSNQAKVVWRIELRIPLSSPVFGLLALRIFFPLLLQKKITLC